MDTQFNLSKILKAGKIENQLEFERSIIADRKLKTLSKSDVRYKAKRKKLRDLIEKYENQNWASDSRISLKTIEESDLAEALAEKERQFIQNRKKLIREKLKDLDLNQQNLGILLGHGSKSYISELMNGVSPFSLRDIIIINRLLKIDLEDLVSTVLPQEDRRKVRRSIKKLDNPNIKLSKEDFALA